MLNYIILGIVQGLTEFFPVSSSAHLVIAQNFLGIREGGVAITVILHLGTLLALIIFFFKDILAALRDKKTLFFILVVTLITGVIGLSGKDFFERLFESPRLAAGALIITGIILILSKKFMQAKRSILKAKDAVILGFTQGVAIIPGISRSGITISTLLFRGIDKELSFKFSFLASIPAILGAALLEAKDINNIVAAESVNLSIGFIFSFFAGLFSLWVLKRILRRAKLHYFGYYCIAVAILTLILAR